MITSSQNSKVKLIRGLLSSKKDRDESGLYVIEGVHLAEEALNAGGQPEFALFTVQLSNRGQAVIQSLTDKKCEVEEVSPELMDRISDTQNSQGILMAVHASQARLGDSLNLVMALDQVRDPGNMGTLLRSAAALGVQAVFLTQGSADAYAPKVLRSGMGAHFKLKIASMSPEEIHAFCKSTNKQALDILLADSGKGRLCWEEDLTRPLCLVIGGEAAGAGDDFRQIIDAFVQIPMLDNTESYNAAVAGSILMYETFRQRKVL
ncbi:MAG: RNA methyltransferase [Pelolinea sp.]|nr:RNA methyltransferase [Pelolinea sp.]